jgi:hypothetical protein
MNNSFTELFAKAFPPEAPSQPVVQPLTININNGSPSRKTLTTSRDANGNLIANVVEVPDEEVQKADDVGNIFTKVARNLRDKLRKSVEPAGKASRRIVHKFRIDEISAVGRSAQEGARAVIIKSADVGKDAGVGGVHVATAIGNESDTDPRRKKPKKPNDVRADVDAELEGADAQKRVSAKSLDDKPSPDDFTPYGAGPAHYRLQARFWEIKQRKPNRHPAESYQEAWNAITEADRSELRHIADDDSGDETLNKRDFNNMNNSLDALVKRHGIPALAKFITENGSDSITESEFVKHVRDSGADITEPTIMKACRRLHEDALNKYNQKWFSSPERETPEYLEGLQKVAEYAMAAAKGDGVPSRSARPQGGVGIAITEPTAIDPNDPEAALSELIRRETAANPFQSPERIRRRCEAARAAHQAIANAKRPRQIV